MKSTEMNPLDSVPVAFLIKFGDFDANFQNILKV